MPSVDDILGSLLGGPSPDAQVADLEARGEAIRASRFGRRTLTPTPEQAATLEAQRQRRNTFLVEAAPPAGAAAASALSAPLAGISPAIPAGLGMGTYAALRMLQPRMARALGVEPPSPPTPAQVTIEAAGGELGAYGIGRAPAATARGAGRVFGRRLAQREAGEALEAAKGTATRAGLEAREVTLATQGQAATLRVQAEQAAAAQRRAQDAARTLTDSAREAERLAAAAERAATSTAGRVATAGKGVEGARRALTEAETAAAGARAGPTRALADLQAAERETAGLVEAVTGEPFTRQASARIRARLEVNAATTQALRAFRRQADEAFDRVRVLAGADPVIEPTAFDETIRRLRSEGTGTPQGPAPFARRTDLGDAGPIEALGGVAVNPNDPYQRALLEAVNAALGQTTTRKLTFDQAHRIQAQLRDIAFKGAAPIGNIRAGEAAAAYRAIREDLERWLEAPGQGGTKAALDAARQSYRLGKRAVNGSLRRLFRENPDALTALFKPFPDEALLDFKAIVGERGYQAATNAWVSRLVQDAEVVARGGARVTDPRKLLAAFQPYERSGALDLILPPESAARVKAQMTTWSRLSDAADLVTSRKGALLAARAEATRLEREADLALRSAELKARQVEAIDEQVRAAERRLAAQQAQAAAETGAQALEAARQRAQAAADRLRQAREAGEAQVRAARERALTADRALVEAKERAAALGLKEHGGLTPKELGWFLGRTSAVTGGGLALGLDPYTAGVLGATFGAAGGRLGTRLEQRVITPNVVRDLMGGRLPGVSERAVETAARLLGYEAAQAAGRAPGGR